MFRAYRFRLRPTEPQAARLSQFSGVCRLIYNLAWEQRRDFWRHYKRDTGRNINFPSQCRELTDLRAQFDWIADVDRVCQEQALRDLDQAFENFFRGRAKYPAPRRKSGGERVRFAARLVSVRDINTKWSEAWLPKIGFVRFRKTRAILGITKNVTVSKDALGWHISFACDVEREVTASTLPPIGIDRGIANTLVLSTGEMLSLPDMTALDRRKRKAQRVLARKKRGSVRRAKALRRVSRLSAKIARVRKDWHHKSALNISKRFGSVVLEDLQIGNMTASAAGTIESQGQNVAQKRGLNRAIMNQGWFAFETILAYKLEERGGTLVKVPAAYTSQTCSDCGVVDAKSRESQAVFVCRHCGFTAHADHNAALNILRGNTSAMRVEGSIFGRVETRTLGGLSAVNRVAKAA